MEPKDMPTAHAPAQASLLGSFQTSLRGEPHPCGDLLCCAFLGPFLSHVTPVQAVRSLRLEPSLSGSRASGCKPGIPGR